MRRDPPGRALKSRATAKVSFSLFDPPSNQIEYCHMHSAQRAG